MAKKAVPFALMALFLVAGWSAAQSTNTYCSTDPPLPIPAGGTSGNMTPATIDVPECDIPDGRIQDVNVIIDLDHTWDGDLDVWVTSAAGLQLTMWTGVNGSGDGFDVVIDDETPPPLTSGNCNPGSPGGCDGNYQPEDYPIIQLANWDGEDQLGTWRLNITDNAGGDSGTLNEFCVEITCDVPPPGIEDLLEAIEMKLDQLLAGGGSGGTGSGANGNNGVGNGQDPAPPGNPPENDGPDTGPGNPGNKGGTPGNGHNGN